MDPTAELIPVYRRPRPLQRCLRSVVLAAAAAILLPPSAVQAQQLSGEEYVLSGYNEEARDNPVARLERRLASGELQLEWREPRGYFDALLTALGIDADSQVLVFSKTSLQYPKISWDKPRGIYFSDDTWVGFVQNSDIVEITTLDERLGAVFYTFHNVRQPEQPFERLNHRCLVCHDSNGTMGGGIPLLLARSALYDTNGNQLRDFSGIGNTTDQTPFAERWGGWFVTGQHGAQTHFGNMQLPDAAALTRLDAFRRGNLDTLDGQGLFDTTPYIRSTSDLVALLVLEHQLTVLNQLTYVKFKAPAVLARAGLQDALASPDWNALPERGQRSLRRMLDRLLALLLLQDSIRFEEPVRGNAGFQAWFEAQGPHDAQGRSLRELDLDSRLFRYPLSPLIHSTQLQMLPAFARDYLYRELAAVLQGHKPHAALQHLTAAERLATLDILRGTLPAIQPYLDSP